MKKWIFMLLLAGSIQGVYAQKTEKKDKFNPNTPLFEELTDVKKKTDKFNLYLNMQGSFDAHFQNGFQEGDFNMHQLRIEAKGNINNWLSYRYRQRLNRSNDANGMIDNLPTSIDVLLQPDPGRNKRHPLRKPQDSGRLVCDSGRKPVRKEQVVSGVVRRKQRGKRYG